MLTFINNVVAGRFCGVPTSRLVCAIALALISVSTVCFMPQDSMQWVVRYLGYYFLLAILCGFIVYCWLAFRSLGTTASFSRKELTVGCVSVLIGSWVIFLHATLDYKIAMDDYLLASTAKSLHETREVSTVTLGNYWGGTFITQEARVDKRPWLYPFGVALLHDVFGYSEIHPFLFNSVVCVVFLGLVYIFGLLLAGWRAGVLSVLLWASLPLLSQNATGAGMEMLNLCLLQFLCVLCVLYLKKPSSSLESLLSLAAVLISYTRYESGLFIIPVGIVIIIGWWRESKIFLGWGTILSSISLIAVALQTQIYAQSEASWELSEGVSNPFGWTHFIANVPHAVYFFLSADGSLANSLLLGVVAVPAILAFAVLLRTELRIYWRDNPAGLVSLIFLVFILMQFAIMLSFHAGQLDRRFVSRYSLPFHLAVVSSTIAVLGYASARHRVVWPVAWVVSGLCILAFTLPSNSRAIFNQSNFVVRELNWLKMMAHEELEPRSLYLDSYTEFWSLEEISAIPLSRANRSLSRLMEYLDNEVYSEAYIIRRASYSQQSFSSEDIVFDQLQSKLLLELIAERSFRPLELTQIYRIVEPKNGYLENIEMKDHPSE
jgi:hypothetical protein